MVFPYDKPGRLAPATIRRDLEDGCKQLQGFHYQIVALQAAVQTLGGHPNRLHEWTRAAIEMAEKYA